MVDIAVKSGAAWVCRSERQHLAAVLRPVLITDDHEEDHEANRGSPVLLEQTEEGSPCVLMLHCSPSSSTAISRLLLVSEARTMEVYSQRGEYCGTVRGERDDSVQPDGSDRGPFYKKQLILEQPCAACEVKLLSLAGRSSVLVCRVVVGLQPLQLGPAGGAAIDMQQVQCLVDEMGANLSPGAQNLMEMVHFQQKNQTGSLGSFLPLLMGSGALSALTQGVSISPAAISSQLQPEHSRPPVGPAHEAPAAQNGVMSDGVTSPELLLSAANTENTTSRGPVSHGQLSEMMSHLLKGHSQVFHSNPELLPALQSVCDQVTRLRLDQKQDKMMNGSWELDSAMERRLEDMERRLKEHVDRRLDALEQKLEKALLSALHQGALSSSTGEAAPSGAQAALTPAMH